MLFLTGCIKNNSTKSSNNESEIITIKITVLYDNPVSKNYLLPKNEPNSVSLYEYVKNESIPGASYFKKLKTFPLKKVGSNKYVAIIQLNISDLHENYTYCIGYPPLNYIDKNTCLVIKVTNNMPREINGTIHYWRSQLAIG
ncbi:hypothetical protein Metig_1435 [Methanotorris igneus Kol 5]|uniref:Uncharacterized protein n=2 Tax=Methanotorris igneus TaxID=2189 RepID=F6BAF7_METIK|nr:hypothetical protein Metig_1435 [Methanotorris igneus Kol 5]